MKVKVLDGYEMKFVNVKYLTININDNCGYQCGCGGDDHEQFDEINGCKCFCHGEDKT